MELKSNELKLINIMLGILAIFYMTHSIAKRQGGDFYVSPNGLNTNDCQTIDTPCFEIQHVIEKIRVNNDYRGANVIIHLADGEYRQHAEVNEFQQITAILKFEGNIGNPRKVNWIAPADQFALSVQDFSIVDIMGVSFTGTKGGGAIIGRQFTVIDFSNVDFGNFPSGTHIRSSLYSIVQATGNYTISGGAFFHANSSMYSLVALNGVKVNIPNPVSFDYFAPASQNAFTTGNDAKFIGNGAKKSSGLSGIASTNGIIENKDPFPGSKEILTQTGGKILFEYLSNY